MCDHRWNIGDKVMFFRGVVTLNTFPWYGEIIEIVVRKNKKISYKVDGWNYSKVYGMQYAVTELFADELMSASESTESGTMRKKQINV